MGKLIRLFGLFRLLIAPMMVTMLITTISAISRRNHTGIREGLTGLSGIFPKHSNECTVPAARQRTARHALNLGQFDLNARQIVNAFLQKSREGLADRAF